MWCFSCTQHRKDWKENNRGRKFLKPISIQFKFQDFSTKNTKKEKKSNSPMKRRNATAVQESENGKPKFVEESSWQEDRGFCTI